MSALEFRFLGDFAVVRDGEALPLPPSKKTRALLAYLSLNDRAFRREHLCELLWEIPDDPRGSLRWSLSKLRRLVDDEDEPRIVADRNSVRVATGGVDIDVTGLRKLAGNGLDAASVADLEAAAARYRGNFLEGLEFANFHDFHSWCVAEREQAIRDQAALLKELVSRLGDTPEQALPHARALVGLAPYDEDARAALIRLLVAARQPTEADEQYRLGIRMLKEAGIAPGGALAAARRAPEGPVPARASAPSRQASGTHPESHTGPPGRGALVGREDQLRRLGSAFESVRREGRARLVYLRGQPGIGKSRIMQSFQEMTADSDSFILEASAFESDTIRPFALWLDALRARRSADTDAIFGASEGDNRGDNRDRLFSGLAGLIERESANGGVILLFDDMHWGDESSAAALHYVVRMNRERPVFGIVAARDGELRDNSPVEQALRGLRRDGLLDEIEVGPLGHDALATLIGAQAPGVDADRLADACAGNPLLALELARAEGEGLGGSSLAELVRERLARFTTEGADIIRWAAVLQPDIDVPTLARLTGLDEAAIGDALGEAERLAMLEAAGSGLRFAHTLIARAVYKDISPVRRRVMHRRIAQLREQDTELDLDRAASLAHHATQSGDERLAARAMVLAGRLSLRFFANDDARSLAKRGLQFARSLGDAERVRTEIELQEILLASTPLEDWEARANLFTALAEQALDHGDIAHASLGYHLASYIRWSKGEWDGAREQSLQSARVTHGTDNKAHIVGMAETARCLVMLERDLAQADGMLAEAAALAGRRDFAHNAIPAGLGMLRYHENRLDEAEELLQQSRALAKSAGDRLNEFLAGEYLVMVALQRGRVATACTRARALVGMAEKMREGSEKPFADALVGLCVYMQEDDDSELDAALEALRFADAKFRLAYVLTRAAIVDCERGRKASAVERASEALENARVIERPTEMLLAHAVLACGYDENATREETAAHAAEVERLEKNAAAWTADVVRRLRDKLEADA